MKNKTIIIIICCLITIFFPKITQAINEEIHIYFEDVNVKVYFEKNSLFIKNNGVINLITDELQTNNIPVFISPNKKYIIYAKTSYINLNNLIYYDVFQNETLKLTENDEKSGEVREIIWAPNSIYIAFLTINENSGFKNYCIFKITDNKLNKEYYLSDLFEEHKPYTYFDFVFDENKIIFKSSLEGTNSPDTESSYKIWEINLDTQKLKMLKYLIEGEEIIEENVFSDISIEIDLFNTVLKAHTQGWISGYPDGTIRLDSPVNRAEFAKMLMLAFDKGEGDKNNLQKFPDVLINEWYAGVLSKAVELGTMQGYPDGKMRPGNTINQAEALKMALEIITDDFEEKEEEEWYERYIRYAKSEIDQSCAVAACQELEFLNDKDYGKEMTRGDCIMLISKVLEKIDN